MAMEYVIALLAMSAPALVIYLCSGNDRLDDNWDGRTGSLGWGATFLGIIICLIIVAAGS